MLHEETSQPKASGISSEAGRPHPDGELHSQSLPTQIKKGIYRVVKVHGNQVDIWDFRGNISTVHITDMKKTTLTDEVADDYLQLCNEERFAKKCVPRGYIPDLNWTTIHDNPDQPIKPVKQKEDPNETTATPAAPTEVKGPPSSHLRSKTKQQTTTIRQEQPEHPDSLGSCQDYFGPALNGHQKKKCVNRKNLLCLTIFLLIDMFLFVGTQRCKFLHLNIYLQPKAAKILNFFQNDMNFESFSNLKINPVHTKYTCTQNIK